MHIKQGDTVLHISFGDEAYGRADVFCGSFTRRQVGDKPFQPINIDTPRLPFKDKQFDVVYATQVLQYTHHPKEMLDEIRRVGKAAHIREYTEFAEMLFGWPEHIWVLDIEGDKLVIRRKNQARYNKFGPLFHNLYQDDQSFYEVLQKNDSLMKLKIDWYEKDDEMVVVEEDVVEELPTITNNAFSDELDDDLDSDFDTPSIQPITTQQTYSPEVKKVKKTIANVMFRPTEADYFDHERIILGGIQELVDIM